MSNTKRERAQELRKKGLTLHEIAKILGVTRQRVHQLLDSEYNASRRKLSTVSTDMLDSGNVRV